MKNGKHWERIFKLEVYIHVPDPNPTQPESRVHSG